MDHTIDLIQKSHEGDEEAREKIVVDNMGLIWSVVKRFTNRGYDPEDLFQIGSIGLMKAVDKFDLSYDVKFSTYAVPMITGEIKRFSAGYGRDRIQASPFLKRERLQKYVRPWRVFPWKGLGDSKT